MRKACNKLFSVLFGPATLSLGLIFSLSANVQADQQCINWNFPQVDLATDHANMRDRVQIDNYNLKSDSGQTLRGAPFFIDTFGIDHMLQNEAAYRTYFNTLATDYNINLIRISPWIGKWENMQKNQYDVENPNDPNPPVNPYYDYHRCQFTYMVDTVVKWAEEEGIYAVVNLHTRYFTEFMSPENAQRAKDFWDVFAPRYKDKTHVVYELINEPEIQSVKTHMSDIYQHARAMAPDTHMILWSPANSTFLTTQDITDHSVGIDYSNASVGWHVYEWDLSKTDMWDRGVEFRDAQYTSINTEFFSLANADYYPIDYDYIANNIKIAEERGLSWMQWAPIANYLTSGKEVYHYTYNPETGLNDLWAPERLATHDDMKFTQQYKDALAIAGVNYWPKDNGTSPSVNDTLSFADVISSVDASGNISVDVNYSAALDRDVVLEVFEGANWAWKGQAKSLVTAGSGSTSVSVSLGSLTGSEYQLKISIRPVGGNWDTAIEEKFQTGLSVSTSNTDEAEIVPVPTSLNASGDVTVSVDYSATEDRDIVLELFTAQGAWLGQGKTVVSAGTGATNVSLSAGTLAAGNYQLKIGIRPLNGDWTTSLGDTFYQNIQVSASGGSANPDINLHATNAKAFHPDVTVYSNYAVGDYAPGRWVKFDNVDLSDGYSSVDIDFATNNTGVMEVRDGSPTGSILATVNYGGGTDWNTFITHSSAMAGTGTKTLYFVMVSGWANVSNISFTD